jgi:hypothetical protein
MQGFERPRFGSVSKSFAALLYGEQRRSGPHSSFVGEVGSASRFDGSPRGRKIDAA